MNFWVVKINGKDPLPGGYYRSASKVSGPFSSMSDAEPKLNELKSKLTDYDWNIERIAYFIWSDDNVEQMRRVGTRI